MTRMIILLIVVVIFIIVIAVGISIATFITPNSGLRVQGLGLGLKLLGSGI